MFAQSLHTQINFLHLLQSIISYCLVIKLGSLFPPPLWVFFGLPIGIIELIDNNLCISNTMMWWFGFQTFQLKKRIHFKLATLTYKALALGSPACLSYLLASYNFVRTFCSSDQLLFQRFPTKTNFGSRVFRSAAPFTWNSLCVTDSNRRRLRSSSSSQLVIWLTRLSTVGDRAFSVAGSRLWNSLPPDVTSAPKLTVFRNRLKTFLFFRSFPN